MKILNKNHKLKSSKMFINEKVYKNLSSIDLQIKQVKKITDAIVEGLSND